MNWISVWCVNNNWLFSICYLIKWSHTFSFFLHQDGPNSNLNHLPYQRKKIKLNLHFKCLVKNVSPAFKCSILKISVCLEKLPSVFYFVRFSLSIETISYWDWDDNSMRQYLSRQHAKSQLFMLHQTDDIGIETVLIRWIMAKVPSMKYYEYLVWKLIILGKGVLSAFASKDKLIP